VISTSTAILTNYSLRYGKGIVLQGASMLTPFVEIGYHKWDRGVNFGEIYSNNYLGLGVLSQAVLASRFVLSVEAMYGQTIQSAIVVNSGPSLTGFSASLGNSVLNKVGISLDYALTPAFHVNAGYDFSAFSYGISATQPTGLLEPDSLTKYTTLSFGLGIGF
jgi:hypothetical protein